jgi:hypothetical protein
MSLYKGCAPRFRRAKRITALARFSFLDHAAHSLFVVRVQRDLSLLFYAQLRFCRNETR